MKKLTSILSLFALLVLAGCFTAPESTDTATTTPPMETEEPVVVEVEEPVVVEVEEPVVESEEPVMEEPEAVDPADAVLE